MSGTPKIVLSGVHKAFRDKVVLDGVDLSVASGESVVIIGGSGTGKSVMLKCILGLIQPDAGSVRIDGQEIVGLKGRELEQVRAKIGMLFQGGALFDSLPVWRNVIFALSQGKLWHVGRLRNLAIEMLERVGLGPEVANLRPSELSGGMQKRVALARAIAAKPEIIFFDEPTTGLDPVRADTINNLIVELVHDLGVTAVTITHDMASARKIGHRVAMLHQGKIVWNGPRDQLYSSGNAQVEQFVRGDSEGWDASREA